MTTGERRTRKRFLREFRLPKRLALPKTHAVGVRRVGHDHDLDVPRRVLLERLARGDKNAAVLLDEVSAEHALLARKAADKDDHVAPDESVLDVDRRADTAEVRVGSVCIGEGVEEGSVRFARAFRAAASTVDSGGGGGGGGGDAQGKTEGESLQPTTPHASKVKTNPSWSSIATPPSAFSAGGMSSMTRLTGVSPKTWPVAIRGHRA